MSLPDPIDTRLERAFKPPPDAIDRLVRGALHSPPAESVTWPWGSWRTGLVAALTVLVLVVTGSMWWRAPETRVVVQGTVTTDGEIVVVKMPGRGIWLMAPGAGSTPTPSGTARVVTFGDMK